MANRLILIIALGMGMAASAALAQGVACKVYDPELQGAYRGSCVNGVAHGAGEAWGAAYYRGEFAAGRKHGQGLKVWFDTGDRYEGAFVEDRKEGHGVYTWGPGSMWSGERYTGAFADDQRHGSGVYTWPSGERHDGPWSQGAPAGPLTDAMRARILAYVAAASASSRVGLRVCLDRTVGIGVRDTLKGTVTAVEGDHITVRIDDAGQLGRPLQGRDVARGDSFTEPSYRWKPCL